MPEYDLYLEDYLQFFVEKEYEPRAVKHISYTDECDSCEHYVSVLVKDDANNYPDTWIDVKCCFGTLESDFNQYIFDIKNSIDRRAKAFQELAIQESNILWELCSSCAEDYVAKNNLLESDWTEW